MNQIDMIHPGRWISAVACALVFSATLAAQTQRGTLTGTVTDKTGAVVPNANVAVTATATGATFNTTSGNIGQFTALNLEPGTYTVSVEKAGFRRTVTSNLIVDAGATIREDVALEIGTPAQSVEVTASAMQLQTENAKSSTVINDQLIRDLPTVVGGTLRSPFDLAILAPETKNFGDNNFQIGGGQAASFGVNLDGVSANTTRALSNSWVAVNTPSLDALTEFTVDTNGFKAEYGQAGGGTINFVSKSGSNAPHGTLYEFIRNEAFDARAFFQAKRQVYKQHDFGGTIGGPVWIPKLYNGRNKSFFFFSYEAFRNRNGATSAFSTVPTPEMYNGDFTNWVDSSGKQIPIYNPLSYSNGQRTVFAGNKIPTTLFDPQAVKAIQAYTATGQIKPNVAGAPGTSNYVRNNYQIVAGSVLQPKTKYSLKGDQYLGKSDRVSFYWGKNEDLEQPGPNGVPRLPGNYQDYNDLNRKSNVYRFTWDHNFTSTLINQFRGGGNDWKEVHNSIQELQGNWKDKFCMGNAPDCNYNLGRIRFDNAYTSWGSDSNNGSENAIISFQDDLTKIWGKHTIKAGGMYQRGAYNGFGRQCVAGCANFSFDGTNIPNSSDQNAGGNAFASFLLGWTSNGQIDTVRYIGQNWPYWAGYVQDDWRVSSKLTINLGLRWETTLPPYEEKDRWSDFEPSRPNPGADNRPGALIFAGDGAGREGSRTLADAWYGGWGPRIGMAYSWDQKTVIRGNFARSFSNATTTTGSTHQKGFTQTTSFPNSSNGVTTRFLLKDGLPPYAVPPFIDSSRQNGLDMPWWQGHEVTRLPEQLNWNLSLQRQITGTLVVDVSYNAVMGTHLQAGLLNYNQIPTSVLKTLAPSQLTLRFNDPTQAAQIATLGYKLPYAKFTSDFGNGATLGQSLRPYPQYTDINTWDGAGDHSGHSSYHAAVVKLDKRFSRGLSLTTSYVLSKIITDADTYWITDNPRAADQYNRRLEKSIGSYDVTHNFKVGYTYELPFGTGKKWMSSGFAAQMLGNWRISAIQLYTSGRPVPITGGNANNLNAGRSAAYVTSYDNWQPAFAKSTFDPAVDRYINASVFPAQNVVGIGNATRFNPKLREFASLQENLSVAKQFKFHRERLSAELRGEAFNIFNRVRFGYGGTNVNDRANLGRVTNLLNDPRRLQLGAKINF